MPELPEVETMVRGLRPQIEQREILEVELCACSRRPIQITPSARVFRRKIARQMISQVFRFAKRVVIELSSGDFIVVEPRMTGLMLVSAPPTQEHRRVCWHLRDRRDMTSSFEFWDRRGLGTVRLLNPTEMTALMASLGPDALQITVDEWQHRLAKTRREVKVAMLDQKMVAGIGNLYASEILHRAGVSPTKPANEVTTRQVKRIAAETTEVLQAAIQYEGSTLSDGTYRNALNKDGGYQNEHRVYQKAALPCPSCARGTIERIVQAQRATFYCPKCQR